MHTFWNVSYHHSLPIQWYISSRNVCIFLCVRKSNNSTEDSLICDWYFANSCKSRLFTSAVKKWCKNKNAIRLWNVMHFVRGRARLVRVKYAFYYRQQQPQHPAVDIWGKICIYSWNWSISVLRTGIHALKNIVGYYACACQHLGAHTVDAEIAHFHVYESARRIFLLVIIYSMFRQIIVFVYSLVAMPHIRWHSGFISGSVCASRSSYAFMNEYYYFQWQKIHFLARLFILYSLFSVPYLKRFFSFFPISMNIYEVETYSGFVHMFSSFIAYNNGM